MPKYQSGSPLRLIICVNQKGILTIIYMYHSHFTVFGLIRYSIHKVKSKTFTDVVITYKFNSVRLFVIFQKVEGEMSPVILTAFNNQPVDAILKEKEV